MACKIWEWFVGGQAAGAPGATGATQQPAAEPGLVKIWREVFIFTLCVAWAIVLSYLLNLVEFAFLGIVEQLLPSSLQLRFLAPDGRTGRGFLFVTQTGPDGSAVLGALIWGGLWYLLIIRPAIYFVGKRVAPVQASAPEDERLARRLRRRSLLLRAFSWFTMTLIVGSLLYGTLAFTGANKIILPDPQPAFGKAPAPESTIEISEIGFLISSLGTRLGAVLILVFLVQILVTLYRYTTRLAAYYDARADALELVGSKSAKLPKMVEWLSPELVQYDEVPKFLLQEVAATIAKGQVAGKPDGKKEEEKSENAPRPPGRADGPPTS